MTYSDNLPQTATELQIFLDDFMSERHFEEYISSLSMSFLIVHFEAKHHNKEGFYAELAYSPKCLALGHTREYDEDGNLVEEFEDELAQDETHIPSWNDGYICVDTKYAEACTECEFDCEYMDFKIPTLWDLVKEKE